jgi:hypothetical protein
MGLAALLLASCAHKPPPTLEQQSQEDLTYYQAQIRKVVKDTAKAEQLCGLAADFQKLVYARAEAVTTYDSKLDALNANYAATRAGYDAVTTQNDKDRNAFLQQALALRTQMAALTTDEEWEQLKDARMRNMEDILKGTP